MIDISTEVVGLSDANKQEKQGTIAPDPMLQLSAARTKSNTGGGTCDRRKATTHKKRVLCFWVGRRSLQ